MGVDYKIDNSVFTDGQKRGTTQMGNIGKIDKNLEVKGSVQKENIVFHNVRNRGSAECLKHAAKF